MSHILKKESLQWHRWEDTTLAKAKEEHKSIFLFIHSPSSKWSREMQEASFNDETIIELFNERFIPIKVNKDERPDIEKYYQKVYKLMNREATSSPLTLFLTPNLEPFYAGSYIPHEDINEQLSLESLLRVVSKKHITDHETLAQKGQEVLSFVEPQEKSIQATKLHLTIIKTIKEHTLNLLDEQFGGFTKAPKFPNASTLELLFDVYQLDKDEKILNAITLTLDNMMNHAFYDRKNGGFYQYAQDEAWEKPYSVKTTYDNAQLIKLYLRAYLITNNEAYKDVAFQTIEFMLEARKDAKLFALEDEAIVTSWNALMVQALFLASNIDEKYSVDAFATLEVLLSELYLLGTLYHSKEQEEKPSTQAFLEDYATLGETLILAYEQSLDESFLIMATQFSNLLIEQYYEQARWVYAKGAFKTREEIYDTTIPSSIASALSLLLSISSLVDNNYKKFVFKTLELHSYNLMRQPLSSPKLSQMVIRYLKDDLIIKAHESLLKEHLNERVNSSYPYLWVKAVNEEGVMLENSHSMLTKVPTFEKAMNAIGDYCEKI